MALLDKVRNTISKISGKLDQNQDRPGVQLLPPVNFKKSVLQPAQQFFKPQTGGLATAGRNFAQNIARKPITLSKPIVNTLNRITTQGGISRIGNEIRTNPGQFNVFKAGTTGNYQSPEPVKQFVGQGLQSSSFGLMKNKVPEPTTMSGKVGKFAGGVAGSIPSFSLGTSLLGGTARNIGNLSRTGRVLSDLAVGAATMATTTPGSIKERANTFKENLKDPLSIAMSVALPFGANAVVQGEKKQVARKVGEALKKELDMFDIKKIDLSEKPKWEMKVKTVYQQVDGPLFDLKSKLNDLQTGIIGRIKATYDKTGQIEINDELDMMKIFKDKIKGIKHDRFSPQTALEELWQHAKNQQTNYASDIQTPKLSVEPSSGSKTLQLQKQVDDIITNFRGSVEEQQKLLDPLTKQLDKLKAPYHSPEYQRTPSSVEGGGSEARSILKRLESEVADQEKFVTQSQFPSDRNKAYRELADLKRKLKNQQSYVKSLEKGTPSGRIQEQNAVGRNTPEEKVDLLSSTPSPQLGGKVGGEVTNPTDLKPTPQPQLPQQPIATQSRILRDLTTPKELSSGNQTNKLGQTVDSLSSPEIIPSSVKPVRGEITKLEKELDEIIGYRDGGQNFKQEHYVRKAYLDEARTNAPKDIVKRIDDIEDRLIEIRNINETVANDRVANSQATKMQIEKRSREIKEEIAKIMKEPKIKNWFSKLDPNSYKITKSWDNKVKAVSVDATPKTTDKITLRQARDQKIQANNDYKEYQRAVFNQEGAKFTARGNATNQLKNIEKSIKTNSTPGGVQAENLKDLSGFKSYTRDVYRNFKEVYGKNYDNIKRVLLDPFDKSKGDLTRAYKGWSDRVSSEVEKGLQIKKGSNESAAVQLFGEGKVTEPELIQKFGSKKTEQIKQADQWFRKEYDKLLGEVNSTMKRIYPNNPEKQIPKRADYYRHFTEMGQGISGLRNIFDNPANISSSLAGTSEFTKPKSKWLSFAQKRLGDKSDIDAVGGFLDYVKAAEYNKNIDPHTAKFRALAEDLALQTEKDPTLNNFIEYLNDYAGDLAGKTNPGDRFIQKVIPGGRKTMSVINWVNNRVKANVILGNASSSIAQIFNVPQGIADAGPKYATKGLGSSIANIFGETTPISKSNFITERYGGNAFDRFDRGLVNNGRKFAAWMTGALDEVGTKYIWNAQYQKALGEGIPDAMKYADDKTRAMVAGRGIGEVPLLQKSKVFQLVAPFQLEVANLWHVMGDWVGEKQFGKLVTFMIASYAFNRGAEAIRGSDVSFDPIQASIEAYNAYSEEEDKRIGAMKAGGRIGGEVLSNVPLGQTVAASYPEYGMKVGDTQLPTREEFFGKGDPTRFGSGLLLTKGLQDPIYKLLPPYGGQQMKRTIEGATASNKGYSETKTGRVRFPTEDTPVRNIQRAVFGEYSTPNARQYFDSNTSTLGDKQSETFKKLPKEKANTYYNQILDNRKKDKVKEQQKEKDGLVKKAGASETSPTTDITYVRSSDNSTQTIKLSDLQKPTGTTLKDYLSAGNRESTIKEIYKGYATGAIKETDMQSAFKQAGVSVREAEDLVIESLPLAQKSSLVYDRLVSPQSTNKDLEGMVDSKLLTTNVITELVDTGKITAEQSKVLKSYLTERKSKLSRKTKKAKKPKAFKPTAFKTIKLKAPKKYLKQKKLTLKDLYKKKR